MPMCGIVQSRGWEIITAALEPKDYAEYFETWDLVINKFVKVRYLHTLLLSTSRDLTQIVQE